MIKLQVYTILLFLTAFEACGQNVFQKNYGGNQYEKGYSVKQTSDEGFIVGAESNSFGNGEMDIYLLKIDKFGDTVWTNTYGGSSTETCRKVNQISTGGYLIAGATIIEATGDINAYLVRTTSMGDTVWTRKTGGISRSYANSFIETNSNEFIVTGGKGSNTVTKFFYYKLNLSGDTIWTRTLDGIYPNSICTGIEIIGSNDGGYVIAGKEVNNGLTFSNGWLIKINDSGDTLWTQQYTGFSFTALNGLSSTSDGGYLLTGITSTGPFTSEEIIIIKTDATGNIEWTKTYEPNGHNFATSVDTTLDGGYIVGGFTDNQNTTSYEFWLLKLDSMGDTMWTRKYYTNGTFSGGEVHQTIDSGYVFTTSIRWPNLTNYDVLLIKTDSLGKAPNLNLWLEEHMTNSDVVIYPNIASSVLNVELFNPKDLNTRFVLYDANGKLILQSRLNSYKNEFDVSALDKGSYYFKIIGKETLLHSGHFIKN